MANPRLKLDVDLEVKHGAYPIGVQHPAVLTVDGEKHEGAVILTQDTRSNMTSFRTASRNANAAVTWAIYWAIENTLIDEPEIYDDDDELVDTHRFREVLDHEIEEQVDMLDEQDLSASSMLFSRAFSGGPEDVR